MERIKRGGSVLATILLMTATAAGEVGAQDISARTAYFRAVAEYFELPTAEVSILADWNLRPDEIPVALFVATRAGISPEALVALRSSGQSWVELTRRYQVGAAQLHVPFAQAPASGLLASVYEQYQARPASEWSEIGLTEEAIVTLINVRVLSTALGMRPDEVLERRSAAHDFVDMYARIIG
ncbi:MAG: hypothetical protein U5R14_12745 [Gemmatimonadota bacterium]|nr:hypothetical protein [Gemmatimonadota bacterium]